MNNKKGIYKKCEVCGKDFYIRKSRDNKNTKFCSRECMGKSFTKKIEKKCDYCGKSIFVEPNRIRKNNFCNNNCKRLFRQKGYGITTDGYVWIIINNEQIKLHRYLMEVKLGRKLLPTEIVHHKDFNKINNSIDNLEILTRSEHNKIHRNFSID